MAKDERTVAEKASDFRGHVYSAYRPHPREEYEVGGPSMTRQEFADECDINNIMKNYEGNGAWPPVQYREPNYLDVSEMPANLQECMNMMMEAESAFMTLPAHARREFDNDPVKFVEFAGNSENIERMREWGLAPPAEKEPGPMKVEVVNPSAPPSKV